MDIPFFFKLKKVSFKLFKLLLECLSNIKNIFFSGILIETRKISKYLFCNQDIIKKI